MIIKARYSNPNRSVDFFFTSTDKPVTGVINFLFGINQGIKMKNIWTVYCTIAEFRPSELVWCIRIKDQGCWTG